MILPTVDLPAPFSPTMACTSPARKSRSTRSRTTVEPKRLTTPLSSHGRPLRGEAHAERISALVRFGHQLVRLS